MNELAKIENNEIVIAKEKIDEIKNLKKAKEKFDLMEKELRQQLKDQMEKLGIKKFIINGLSATLKDATTRKSLDTTRLKNECPDIYEEYLKESPVASSITLTIAD